MNWVDFYKARMNDRYRQHVKTRYAPYLDAVVRAAAVNPMLAVSEYGCGAGFTGRALAERIHSNALCFWDICPQVLELARENITAVRDERNTNTYFNTADIRETRPGYAGVICGHGVLEHFPTQDIHNILEKQRSNSHVVIHYVPTDKYEKPSFGDERLLPARWWAYEFRPHHWETFNDGHDLLLMWYGQRFPQTKLAALDVWAPPLRSTIPVDLNWRLDSSLTDSIAEMHRETLQSYLDHIDRPSQLFSALERYSGQAVGPIARASGIIRAIS